MIDDSGEDGDDTDDAEETTDCCLDPEHELFNQKIGDKQLNKIKSQDFLVHQLQLVLQHQPDSTTKNLDEYENEGNSNFSFY